MCYIRGQECETGPDHPAPVQVYLILIQELGSHHTLATLGNKDMPDIWINYVILVAGN